ncbi:MAG: hypothetical protein CVU34_16340 [Betaproteobacteria bacterium HGW-Betaproteobacteria-7]|jgi:thioesterase domain-containing protein|nr:MAG: hypothetical protein CVU34_16340 [Betaproteobacteria bacterium HGW-Betaproteobacteria-7]
MLTINPEKIDAIKSNAETVMAFSNIVYSSLERLTTLNLKVTRALLEESAAASSQLLEGNGSAKPAKARMAIPEAATQNVVAYLQDVQDLTTETQQELTQLTTTFLAAQGKAANSTAWVKGLEAFKNLGQQVSSIAETNLNAVGDITSRVSASSAAKRT